MVKDAGGSILRGGAFKPRTSPYSFRGYGQEALGWLRDAAREHGLALVTEVLGQEHVDAVAQVADILQVGSRNMQNFALLHSVGRAEKPVMLKRGAAATLSEWRQAAEHLLVAGAESVIFCARGIRGSDPETRNVLDLGGVALLKHVDGHTVFVDPSHAAGRRELVCHLTRAALAAGADGVLVEAHPFASEAMSDGPQALGREDLETVGRLVAQGGPR
jgi:3-deoxy-7-phosphoheptulonate synthase